MLWIVSEWPPVRWLRSTLFWAARPRLLRLRIADAAAMARSRRELAELDEGFATISASPGSKPVTGGASKS